jgi:hypothetical protein
VKPGNAGGAKALCRECASINRKENRLDKHPTTDETARQNADTPAQPEYKSGVMLPGKVSELRGKLGRMAKQEPRFRFVRPNLSARRIGNGVVLGAEEKRRSQRG